MSYVDLPKIENDSVNTILICFADHEALTERFLKTFNDILAADDEPFLAEKMMYSRVSEAQTCLLSRK
jgi:hypothetical protein